MCHVNIIYVIKDILPYLTIIILIVINYTRLRFLILKTFHKILMTRP